LRIRRVEVPGFLLSEDREGIAPLGFRIGQCSVLGGNGAELDEEVDSLVETLVNKSPRIISKIKQGLYTSADLSPSAAKTHMERVSLESAREDPDYREGVDAQLADRDPEWMVE